MKILGNVFVFVLVYVVFLIPTYLLPYLGSNSAVLGTTAAAAGAGINPAFWVHLISLFVLIVIAYFRGKVIGNTNLAVFPFIAALFDLIPVVNVIPLIPTVFHIITLVKGSKSVPQAAQATISS